MQGAPVLVLNANMKQEKGRKAQKSNIAAARAVSEIVRTCLGPRAMLKMVMDAMGGIVITNDGNAILREIDVNHPAAKSLIELSRAQDENVGDGTTSVVILAGEILSVAEPWLERDVHPLVINAAYLRALDDMIQIMNKLAVQIDVKNRSELVKIVNSCLATKFVSRWGNLVTNMAIDAVQTVLIEEDGRKEIDIKRYAKVDKIPGGEYTDSCVLKGVLLNKDVVHASMKRRIENPRILLLDCNLEYKKLESMASYEVSSDEQWTAILKQEEEYIARICNDIIRFKPDIVMTEKGISDLAQHFFVKHNITALRRLKKTDNNRVARAVGAKIVHRTDEINESDIGTGCGLFEIEKIGDDYFAFIKECKDPKACTIILRGGNKDVLNEVERNLQDAMAVARNVVFDPRLIPGGGAIEMTCSQYLNQKAGSVEGVQQWIYKSIASALEVIPRTIAQNAGAKVVEVLTELRAKHAVDLEKNWSWGIDGNKGIVADMNTLGIWEPVAVKEQTYKTAVEAATLLLRVDDVVSGMKKRKEGGGQQGPMSIDEEKPEMEH